MQLLSTEDPRDNLQKATRWELIDFAKANGIDVPQDAPAIYTMKVLRSRGLTNIKIPDRPLGLYTGKGDALTESPAVMSDAEVTTANAEDDLIRQYEKQKKEEADVSNMSIQQVRRACKERGILISRRDNLQTLRAKLSGQNAD